MQKFVLLVTLLVCVGGPLGALCQFNVTIYMEDYIAQNRRQYDANVKDFENELDLFRANFASELRAISLISDQLDNKLAEARSRLDPLQYIDSWHRHCVQNYSSSLPTSPSVRSALTSCLNTANNNLNGVLSNAQSTLNTLRGYYSSNLNNLLNGCVKSHPDSQTNYTNCILSAIGTANTYTVARQSNFNTYMQQARCAADTRVRTAWECSFTTVHSTSSSLGAVLRLVDDCIGNRLACASVSCTASCKNQRTISLNQNDFYNQTISNPFIGLNNTISCLDLKFKH